MHICIYTITVIIYGIIYNSLNLSLADLAVLISDLSTVSTNIDTKFKLTS